MLTQAQVAALSQAVAVAVAQTLASWQAPTQKPKASKPKAKPQPKAAATTDRKAAFAAQVVATYKAKGLTVVPNVDVLTYGKWEALGFRPKDGEKATFVKTNGMNGNGIPLFHKEQVEAV